MKVANSASMIAGLLVAALGLVPLLLIGGGSEPEAAAPSTTTTQPEPVVTEVAVDPPPIGDLDPRVSRVLYAYDAATGVAPGSADELPDEIVKVLAYYDVTLSVAEDGE